MMENSIGSAKSMFYVLDLGPEISRDMSTRTCKIKPLD